MPTGIKHDDVVVLFEFFGDAQPGQPVLIEAMQEQQRGLLASRSVIVLAYAVGDDVTFAPMRRDELLNGTIVFYNRLQVFLLFVHIMLFTFFTCIAEHPARADESAMGTVNRPHRHEVSMLSEGKHPTPGRPQGSHPLILTTPALTKTRPIQFPLRCLCKGGSGVVRCGDPCGRPGVGLWPLNFMSMGHDKSPPTGVPNAIMMSFLCCRISQRYAARCVRVHGRSGS